MYSYTGEISCYRSVPVQMPYGCLVWRVSTETSFVSKQPKLEPKPVSALSKTRHLFRLFRFNIKTGSFDVSKQLKQTKDQPKQQQICLNINFFNSPYHKFCLFQLFWYWFETSKQTGKKFGGFAKKQTEKQPKQIEFRFVSVQTENKIWLFRGHLTCLLPLHREGWAWRAVMWDEPLVLLKPLQKYVTRKTKCHLHQMLPDEQNDYSC
jgi:hypothetical protein